MSKAEPGTRFVVSRLRWSRNFGGGYRRLLGEVALVSFSTFEEADADRWAREHRARARVNPFTCGPVVHNWTSLDEPRLRDWLMDHGVEPPSAKQGATDWVGWWRAGHERLGAETRAAVWEVLDKVRFYSVAARPVCSVVYAVVKIDWEYNDEWHVSSDGGEIQTVYRRRAFADEACTRLNAAERARWEPSAGFDIQHRLTGRRDLFAEPPDNDGYRRQLLSLDQVPFYEVIELELGEENGPRA